MVVKASKGPEASVHLREIQSELHDEYIGQSMLMLQYGCINQSILSLTGSTITQPLLTTSSTAFPVAI
jgi:hypothetical protein